MKVTRECKIDVEWLGMEDRLMVGDRIKVKLDKEKYTATAIQQVDDTMLFLFDQYLDEGRPMNEDGGTEGGYEASDMRKYLRKLYEKFPKKLREDMMPFENGDHVRLLSMQEMFGLDADPDETRGQIPWLKDRAHRVAYKRNGDLAWGWLRDAVSSVDFAFVNNYGYADYAGASCAYAIRPAFAIYDPWIP